MIDLKILNRHSSYRPESLYFTILSILNPRFYRYDILISLENDLHLELTFAFNLLPVQIIQDPNLELKRIRQAASVLLADYRRIRHARRKKLQSAT